MALGPEAVLCSGLPQVIGPGLGFQSAASLSESQTLAAPRLLLTKPEECYSLLVLTPGPSGPVLQLQKTFQETWNFCKLSQDHLSTVAIETLKLKLWSELRLLYVTQGCPPCSPQATCGPGWL